MNIQLKLSRHVIDPEMIEVYSHMGMIEGWLLAAVMHVDHFYTLENVEITDRLKNGEEVIIEVIPTDD